MDLIHFWLQPLLGLDIQAEEIRLVQLHGMLKRKNIKLAVSRKLPPGAVIDGEIQEPDVVSDCLQALMQDYQLNNIEVAIALPGHCVVTQRISIIKGLHEAELEEEIIGYLKHAMPHIKESYFYDYVVMGAKDAVQDDVLLVATSFSHVNPQITAVQNAGFKVRVIDVDQYALARGRQLITQKKFHMEDKWLISLGLAMHGK